MTKSVRLADLSFHHLEYFQIQLMMGHVCVRQLDRSETAYCVKALVCIQCQRGSQISFVMLDFKPSHQLVSLAMKIKVLYASQGHQRCPFISCNQRVTLPTEVIFHSYNINFSWLFVLQKVSLKPADPGKAL